MSRGRDPRSRAGGGGAGEAMTRRLRANLDAFLVGALAGVVVLCLVW
jgi:hypothetical protein